MTRHRLLDLFCGAGGASVGYARAGFEVVGVDHLPQLNYPFEFHQADAMEFPLDGFDVIHASPPCQAYVQMSAKHRGKGTRADSHVDLIGPIRSRLLGRTYVIENVPGARRHLHNPVIVCGSAFKLKVQRHRFFESSILLRGTQHAHHLETIGVYGRHPDGRRLWTRRDGSSQRAARSIEEAQSAMGITWMPLWRELCEAIPPAYTEYLGRQILNHLGAVTT